MGHVIEPPNPVDAYSFSKSFGVHLLPDYGPVCSVKRPVRTRMRGVRLPDLTLSYPITLALLPNADLPFQKLPVSQLL